MATKDLLDVAVVCARCHEIVLWHLQLTDVWGVEVPEDRDEFGWIRALTGDPHPVRRQGAKGEPDLFGQHGPRTHAGAPTYTEFNGHLTLHWICACGARPERRLDRLLRTIAAKAAAEPDARTFRLEV
jgi:hypothetical protein